MERARGEGFAVEIRLGGAGALGEERGWFGVAERAVSGFNKAGGSIRVSVARIVYTGSGFRSKALFRATSSGIVSHRICSSRFPRLGEALVEDDLEGEVGFVSEGFDGLLRAAVAGAAQRCEQGGAQQCKGAGGVGIVGAAGVFVPDCVAQPVDVVFHGPVAAHEHGQARGRGFGGASAGEVVAGAGSFLAALFVRGFAPRADGLGDVGEGGALALERDGA